MGLMMDVAGRVQGENARSKCSINYDPRKFTGLRLQRREPLKTRLVKGDRRTIYPFDSTATLFSSVSRHYRLGASPAATALPRVVCAARVD